MKYELLIHAGLICLSTMFLLWIVQIKTKDSGIVDVAWALLIGIVAIYYGLQIETILSRKILVVGLAAFWSFRLGLFLFFDRVYQKEEDGRYQAIREHWGDKVNVFHFFFFMGQGLLVVFLSLSFFVLLHNTSADLSVWEYLGALVFLIAIVFESIADRQLARFRAKPDNKGKTCREGLWRYSRHPNYFFELFHWLAYVVMAIGLPQLWITLLPAIAMFVFITKLTGIQYTEIQAIKSRGDDYRNYQATTNMLIPWFPKESRDTGASSKEL